MKKFAADNLMFLRTEYPEIYKLIKGRSYDRNQYRPSVAKNGEAIVSVATDLGELGLYSRYNPTLEAERWADSIDETVEKSKDTLFCGLGYGYHLEAFLKRYPDKRIYLYEPQIDFFLCALEHRDLRPLLKDKRIAIFGIGEDFRTQLDLLGDVFVKSARTISPVIVPVYRTAFKDAIQSYQSAIRTTAGSVISSMQTLKRFQNDWTRNKMANMVTNIKTPSIRGMKGVCTGVPAIVIGSGPSLGMAVEHLRQLQNRALLVAAGTSIQALLKYGIEPDLVVTMDPGEYNRKAFETVNLEKIPLLYIPTVHSAVPKDSYQYVMHAFFNLDAPTFYMMGLTAEDPIFQSTATVSGTAIQAAIHLGCSDIILLGQDYSFPGDQFYAEGVGHASAQVLTNKMNQGAEWVENVQGGQNRTNRSMTVAKEGIEILIEAFPSCTFYNASRVGAVIKHTEAIALDQLKERIAFRLLEEKWFIRKMTQYAQPYPPERIKSIQSRMRKVFNTSLWLEKQLGELKLHIDEIKDQVLDCNERQLLNWLTQFEALWAPIVEDEVFRFIYGFFLQGELNLMDRYWSDMHEEASLQKKTTLLLEIFLPVMEAWSRVAPLLRKQLDLLAQTEEFGQTSSL